MSGLSLRLRWSCLVLLLGAAGCGGVGDNLPRVPVSGKVTFEGRPLANGNIQFIPTGPDQMTQVGAMVSGGSYSIERGNGPVPGAYRVLVNAPDQANRTGPAGAEQEAPGSRPFVMPKDLIPRKYNMASTLTAEVTAGGPNHFDFDLKK